MLEPSGKISTKIVALKKKKKNSLCKLDVTVCALSVGVMYFFIFFIIIIKTFLMMYTVVTGVALLNAARSGCARGVTCRLQPRRWLFLVLYLL